MIYNMGDLGGNQRRWLQAEKTFREGDKVIVDGDWGYGYLYGPYPESMFYEHLADAGIQVLFVDGNHEDYRRLNRLPVQLWNGGRVHRVSENVIHLMRGEVYHMDDEALTLFSFGGGFSLDREKRREGVTWFPEELPCAAEYANAGRNLEKANYKVDFIITHAPTRTMLRYMRENGADIRESSEEAELMDFLDEVETNVSYRLWYAGHLHLDGSMGSQIVAYNAIREFETGKAVKWIK